MSEDLDVRASDADRDRAAEQLRDHFAAGRLSEDELDERVQATYQASTRAELTELGGDLPALPVPPEQERLAFKERRAHLRGRVLQQSGAALVPFLICVLIWLAAGASGPFWPAWVALVVMFPLITNGWALYGPAPQLDRVERRLSRSRDQRRHGRHRGHGRHRHH